MLKQEEKKRLRFKDYRKLLIEKEPKLMPPLPQLKKKDKNKLMLKMRE